MKSARLRSLAWCSLSPRRPRNSSYLNHTRYVLTTSVSQYSAICLILPSKEVSLDLVPVHALGLSGHAHDLAQLVQGRFGVRSKRGENIA
jgi:hypothetical protein